MPKQRSMRESSWLSMDPDFDTVEKEHAFYQEILSRVIRNPRFYLDNLEELPSFMCSFIDYGTEKSRKIRRKSEGL